MVRSDSLSTEFRSRRCTWLGLRGTVVQPTSWATRPPRALTRNAYSHPTPSLCPRLPACRGDAQGRGVLLIVGTDTRHKTIKDTGRRQARHVVQALTEPAAEEHTGPNNRHRQVGGRKVVCVFVRELARAEHQRAHQRAAASLLCWRTGCAGRHERTARRMSIQDRILHPRGF